jgi:hypothetical protein
MNDKLNSEGNVKANSGRTFSEWFSNYDIGKGGVLVILLLVTTLPLFILSFYAHPCPDDYEVTVISLQKGFFGAQKYWHYTWTGRYFSLVLDSLNPLVFGANWAYKLNAFILLLLLVIANYWLNATIFKSQSKATKLGLTSLFIFAFIVIMPDIQQGVFYQNGTYQYFVPEILTFFLLGCMIRYYRTSHKKKYFVFSCFLLVAIIGSYEINMILVDLSILLIASVSLIKKRDAFFPLALLSICILFTVLEILAPGNNVRAALEPGSHNAFFSLKQSVIYSIAFLMPWLPFMLFIGLLLFDLLAKRVRWNELADSILSIPWWISLIACLFIPIIGFFLLFWAQGTVPPLRTVNVIYFYFVLGMIYFSLSTIAEIKKRYPDFCFPAYFKLSTYFILVFALFFRGNPTESRKRQSIWKRAMKTNNITAAYADIISGTAAAYSKERNERDTYLRNCKGDTCMIDSIRNIPNTIYFIEFPNDSWYSDYYSKKYIGYKEPIKAKFR